MSQVIIEQLPTGENRLHQCQPRGRSIALGNRRCAVELDHHRGLRVQQHLVQANDLLPVGLPRSGCFGMHRRNCRLQTVRAEIATAQCLLHQGATFDNQRRVPLCAVLLVK
ncbi:hypothetical protein D9M71_310870 [compost metagenome]